MAITRRRVDILVGTQQFVQTTGQTQRVVNVFVRRGFGPGGGDSDGVQTVPVGTTGWETLPDGTLWVEYTP